MQDGWILMVLTADRLMDDDHGGAVSLIWDCSLLCAFSGEPTTLRQGL